MGLFSRIVNFVRSAIGTAHDEALAEVESEVSQQFGEEDELVEIWHNTIEENISDVEDLREFTLDQHGAELFRIGWVDDGDDEEDRQNARDEFFDLMEAYDISRDEFDWDAWRDWYEDA